MISPQNGDSVFVPDLQKNKILTATVWNLGEKLRTTKGETYLKI